MDSKVSLLYREERQRRDACDHHGPWTVKGYLRAQRWLFWAGLFLKLLGCISLGLALGWQLTTVSDQFGWFHTEEVSGVKSGVAGWKWSQIKPSEDLVWYQCYEQYDCARLEVPLDWLDPTDFRRATIAIIRYNATDRTNYNGPVFINPGGPGGSGACYAHAAAFSQQCATQLGDAARFVSTPSVARDMLHIVEKLGESKLKYWGFSYGTFLGTTFASLFPNKVGRMVNDGNVDARDYISGAGTHFLQDTDKVMDSFYTFCHLAGPKVCAFYAPTPGDIKIRVSTLLDDIKKHPVIVPASPSSNFRPEIISYSKVQRLITSALYRPLVMFPSLAEAFAALETGDGRPFLDLTSQGGEELPSCENRLEDPTDPENPTPEVPEAEGSADASKAIMCSDGAPIPGGVDEFKMYVRKLMELSPFEGNTSHPILFIANTADNVTPLRSALANSAGFPGSVVMIQDSYGHDSANLSSVQINTIVYHLDRIASSNIVICPSPEH
ncbi:hypothetical protein IFR05_000212 [Cadophora sp. M221]|nr:hypothetical protein IFR05_000212 [Cadophora sp. M221]